MIMFRLGRCLLVGVQALLIFKGNKITPPHPSHPRRKKKNPNHKPQKQQSKTTQRNTTKPSNLATVYYTAVCVLIPKWMSRKLGKNLSGKFCQCLNPSCWEWRNATHQKPPSYFACLCSSMLLWHRNKLSWREGPASCCFPVSWWPWLFSDLR